MSAKAEEIMTEKDKLVGKALDKDQKPFDLAFDLVLNQLEEEGCSENEEGWFCPEMIEGAGHLITERVPLILEVLYEEDYLERKVNLGVPHYRLKE